MVLILQDIANHQVHALRPYLWTCAPQHELSAFHNTLAQLGRTLQTSKTRDWIKASSRRILAGTEPKERLHLIGRCICGDNTELMVRTVAEGFVELVFEDRSTDVWPPAGRFSREGNP